MHCSGWKRPRRDTRALHGRSEELTDAIMIDDRCRAKLHHVGQYAIRTYQNIAKLALSIGSLCIAICKFAAVFFCASTISGRTCAIAGGTYGWRRLTYMTSSHSIFWGRQNNGKENVGRRHERYHPKCTALESMFLDSCCVCKFVLETSPQECPRSARAWMKVRSVSV